MSTVKFSLGEAELRLGVIAPHEYEEEEKDQGPDQLKDFANKIINLSFDYDLGGEEVQELALKYGLIEQRMAMYSCGEGCRCEEYGDFPMLCRRKTDVLK